jgi:hypothetical protein
MKFAKQERRDCLIDKLELRQLLSVATESVQLATPAATAGPVFSLNSARRLFTDIIGGEPTLSRRVRYKNISGKTVTIPAGGIAIKGADASMFKIANPSSLPRGMKTGTAMNLSIVFDPPSGTSPGIKTALLTVSTTGGDSKSVRLRAIATTGTGGSNEPSLQRVFDLFQLRIAAGDSNSNDYLLDLPPKANNEIDVQRLVKAGPGLVTFEPLAMFIVPTQPALKFGWYDPGNIGSEHELFSIASEDANSVTPVANGTTYLDPGSQAFGIYAKYPGFKNADNTIRTAYSEDALNTWDANASKRRKARFYPLKNPDGTAVANAYVVAFEDFDANVDNQDGIFIVRNVKPAPSGAEIGVQNLDLPPFPDRIFLSKVQTPDPTMPLSDHRSTTLRIFNSGSAPLTISSISTTGAFATSGVTLPATVAKGSHVDLVVTLTANGTKIHTGNLTIASNDADESSKVVPLSGWWQSQPENNLEPVLVQQMPFFGIGTTIVGSGQNISTGGKVQVIGDEILSPYWVRANTGMVTVREISSWHAQATAAKISWYTKGTGTLHTIFTEDIADVQRAFPRLSGSTQAAARALNIDGTFGFKVNGEWSDPKKNVQEQTGGGYGHHIRFFPVKDLNGQIQPDTYLMCIDYQSVNFDYQDNVYLITNIRPEGVPASPAGLNATASTNGISLDWQDAYDSISSYSIFRSSNPDSGFGLVKSLVENSEFTDTGVPAGVKTYYRVVAVDSDGSASLAATTFATRPVG